MSASATASVTVSVPVSVPASATVSAAVSVSVSASAPVYEKPSHVKALSDSFRGEPGLGRRLSPRRSRGRRSYAGFAIFAGCPIVDLSLSVRG